VDEMRLTVSLGVSSYDPGISIEPDSLVALADQALYAAKQGGRDQVRFAEGSPVHPTPGDARPAEAPTAPFPANG